MCKPSNNPYSEPEYAASLVRAEALERKITALCAQINAANYRLLRSRDGGCRFPGCTHHRSVDAHHIRHWANGGTTSLDNLVLLCRRHHRLVHEGGFGVERIARGAIRFTRPDGRVVDEHPGLLASGDIGSFRDLISGEAEPPIDASGWIIPEGVMDLDLADSGLIRLEETQTPLVERSS